MFANNVELRGMKRGCIIFDSSKSPRVYFGFGGTMGIDSERSLFSVEKGGKVIFEGSARFAKGCKIRVESGVLRIGSNFAANKNCFFSCTKEIIIGSDTLFAWNVNIRDSDGHSIIQDGIKKSGLETVKIGNHVWAAAYVDILKGVTIPNNCVISYRSCVIKPIIIDNTLIGGYPARILKENINWEI